MENNWEDIFNKKEDMETIETNNKETGIAVGKDVYREAIVKEYENLKKSDVVLGIVANINPTDIGQISEFGIECGTEISKIADEILNIPSLNNFENNSGAALFKRINKVIEKVSPDEMMSIAKRNQNKNFFYQMLNTNKIKNMMNKYNTIGSEVEQITTDILSIREEMKQEFETLSEMRKANYAHIKSLQEHQAAADVAIEKLMDIQLKMEQSGDINNGNKINSIKMTTAILQSRKTNLSSAEAMAMQNDSLIEEMAVSRIHYADVLQSTIIITLPAFKTCIANALLNKQQSDYEKGVDALNKVTEKMIKSNAKQVGEKAILNAQKQGDSVINISVIEESTKELLDTVKKVESIRKQKAQDNQKNTERLIDIKTKLRKLQVEKGGSIGYVEGETTINNLIEK